MVMRQTGRRAEIVVGQMAKTLACHCHVAGNDHSQAMNSGDIVV
jgi:hypothetical protein